MALQAIGAPVPQSDLPTSTGTEVPENDMPAMDTSAQAGAEVPESDLPTDYGTASQQVGAGFEGLAKGVAGPIATAAELGAHKIGLDTALGMDTSAEAQTGREEANPWTHGITETAGLLGGALIPGLGEYSLGAKAAEAANAGAKAINAGKVGSAAIKGMIETGLFQTSDELSKAMLGQGNPEDAVSHVLMAAGAGGLLGGTFGAVGKGLNAIADTKSGQAASRFIEDFGAQWDRNLSPLSANEHATNELNAIFQSTLEDNKSTWGENGLKAQNLDKIMPEMSDAIATQNRAIGEGLQNKFSEMAKDPDAYPPRLVKKFQEAVLDYIDKAHGPDATPAKIFAATDDLKGWLQDYAKFDKQVGPLSPEKQFIDTVKGMSNALRKGLEDTNVWGKAGELQADTNSKFKAYYDAKKDLVKKFTQKIGGESTIDPDKVAAYVNRTEKGKGALTQGILEKFKSAAEDYRSHVEDLHSKLGFDYDMMSEYGGAHIPTPTLDATLSEASSGTKAANEMFNTGSNKLARNLSETALGGVLGSAIGGPLGAVAGAGLGAISEPLLKLVGRPVVSGVRKYVVPAILRTVSSDNATLLRRISDYAETAAKGNKRLSDHIENLFQKSGQQALEEEVSEKERQKIKDYVENGDLNKQIQAQLNPSQPQTGTPGKFAEGGMVEKPSEPTPDKTAVKPLLQGTDAISRVYPDQAMLLGTAKGRVNDYLNSIRPQHDLAKAPFDDEFHDPEKERQYKSALDIAARPLSVLDHAKKGTLEPDQIKHFNMMYPEVASQVNKKLNERILKAQMDGDKPSYHVRQSLSLLMGTPLDGVLSPASIQAAQAVFAQQAAQQQAAPQKPKKGTGTLNKASEQYQTATQSAEARQSAKG